MDDSPTGPDRPGPDGDALSGTGIPIREELENLKERVRNLAVEKSNLQLITQLMNRLGEVTGLENTLEHMLRIVLEHIGGSRLVIYYLIGGDVHFVDVVGNRGKLDAVDDDLVRTVFESHEFVEQEHDFRDTEMMTVAFTKASTWVFPLLVGPEIVGVIKIEGLIILASSLRVPLQAFFNYAALILNNEIQGYTRLQKAHDLLNRTNAELKVEITERKLAEEALRELSLKDDLTGLNNRRGFMLLAAQQVRIAARLKQKAVLIYADLDDLKEINDTLGHEAGDRALVDIANILKDTLRTSDTVARLGGDEFAGLAMDPADSAGAPILARLKNNVDAFNRKKARPYVLSVSLGAEGYDPAAPVPLEELLKRADALMYEQKQRRRASRKA